jgi:16S rRNA (guanine527-N7)-methyltransferase
VKHSLDAAAFADAAGASPEQMERLHDYLALLRRWQPRINLVGSRTLEDPWRRHFLDSAQLAPLLPPNASRIADLGSGAGFPGLVLAILTGVPVTLIEADQRKGAFLVEAARVTAAKAEVVRARIESLTPANADVVTARALAPLPRLLDYAANWLAPNGICLFLKGRSVADELTEAQKNWKMQVSSFLSRSDAAAMILRIDQISRRA